MVQLKLSDYIWMDGKFEKWKNAKVHVLTHALLYGSAVFEGIHAYRLKEGTAVFRLDDHLMRLFHSANSFGMKIKFSMSELRSAIKLLARKNGIGDSYIRPTAYYGCGGIGVYPSGVPTNVMIISIPWKKYFSKNLKVVVSSYVRHSEKSSVFGVKITGNYANSILAMHEARAKGYDEALMLDCHGNVAEGPAENLFAVKDGRLMTPNSRSALHGITRDTILRISKDMGIQSYEKKMSLGEVRNADELFFCGTMMEIAPIASINGKIIGNGKTGRVTKKIMDKYYDVVRGSDRRYENWLAYVG